MNQFWSYVPAYPNFSYGILINIFNLHLIELITKYNLKFQILTCTARICDQTSCKSEVDALTCPVDASLSYVHAKDILAIPAGAK